MEDVSSVQDGGQSAETCSLSDSGRPISQSDCRSRARWVGPRAVGGLRDVKDWRRRLFKQRLIRNWLETSAVWVLIIAGVKPLPVGAGDSLSHRERRQQRKQTAPLISQHALLSLEPDLLFLS